MIQNGVGYDAFISRLEQRVAVEWARGDHDRRRARRPRHRRQPAPLVRRARSSRGSRPRSPPALERQDPAHAAAYRRGLARFDASLAPLQHEVAAIRSVVRRPRRRLHRARARLPARRGRAAEPRAGGVHPRDRGRHRALARRRVGDDRARDGARRIKVLLYNTQAVSPITSRIRDGGARRGHPDRRSQRDAACRRDLPVLAARPGPRARSGAGLAEPGRPGRLGRRPAAQLRRAPALGGPAASSSQPRRVAGRARAERHRQDVADPDHARAARSRRPAGSRSRAAPPAERRSRIGYVPQQRVFERDLPVRGRDLVRFGLDGHRFGLGRLSRADAARDRPRPRGGGRRRLRRRADRPPVGRRAAAAPDRAGARLRPRAAAGRRAAALARPRLPARDRRPARRAPPPGRDAGRVRHARHQPGAADRRPRPLPRARAPGRSGRPTTCSPPRRSRASTTPTSTCCGCAAAIVVVGTPDDQHVHHLHEDAH